MQNQVSLNTTFPQTIALGGFPVISMLCSQVHTKKSNFYF